MKTLKERHLRLVRKDEPVGKDLGFDPGEVERFIVEEAARMYGVSRLEA